MPKKAKAAAVATAEPAQAAAAAEAGAVEVQRKMISEEEALERYFHQQVAAYENQQRETLTHRTLLAGEGETNVVPLEDAHRQWKEQAPGKWIRYEQFKSEKMELVMKMFAEELPEPYSVFTYEHFLVGWPDLALMVYGHEGPSAPKEEENGGGGEFIGCIVSKVSLKLPERYNRGYIAMLAVRPKWRSLGIAKALIRLTVEMMKKKNAHEVCLETPMTNEKALRLYTGLGFAKTKHLIRYYMDGSDAYRLKLWFGSQLWEQFVQVQKQAMQEQKQMLALQQQAKMAKRK